MHILYSLVYLIIDFRLDERCAAGCILNSIRLVVCYLFIYQRMMHLCCSTRRVGGKASRAAWWRAPRPGRVVHACLRDLRCHERTRQGTVCSPHPPSSVFFLPERIPHLSTYDKSCPEPVEQEQTPPFWASLSLRVRNTFQGRGSGPGSLSRRCVACSLFPPRKPFPKSAMNVSSTWKVMKSCV